MSKNISAEGLCFISDRQLKKGDRLYLELYLPKREQPIRMEGQVRWSQAASAEEKENNKFETGVKLTVVEGRSVMTSIHYDEANHLVWSITLESIFGNFRKLAQNQ
ncbi:MAG: PilZ domain-containing protein, partial [Candidatus Omnitrophica bacterium]|nr:PilZ domain-containing protein [Candidatus Omnitrophota bacterium]